MACGAPHETGAVGGDAVGGGAVFLVVGGAELLEEHAAKGGGRLLFLGGLRGKRDSEQEEECKLSHGCDLVVRRVYRQRRFSRNPARMRGSPVHHMNAVE